MLKRLYVLPILALASACSTAPAPVVDPAARRAMMQALPTQGSCQPAAEGARNCTIRLGSKDAQLIQSPGVTTIRYRSTDTAEPEFLNGLRRVLTTAGTADIDRAMSIIARHGRSGAMAHFSTGCFPEGGQPPVSACFVTVSY